MPCLILLTLALLLPPADPSPSALEADPNGWRDLIAAAGKDLNNWSRVPIPPTGRLNPQSQWSVDEPTGNLVCEGDKGHEWLRFETAYSDFIYHVEWRFTPITSGKPGYNSGIYARNSADGKVWLQVQTGSGSGGFLFGESLDASGKPVRVDFAKKIGPSRVKPAGEWNTFEVTCKGKQFKVWANGAETLTWDDCLVPTGYVGLEAEGYRIEFRKVLIKPIGD